MIPSLVLIKVLITVSLVLLISFIAERVSPRVAGIISGFPLGSAIVLFFLGLQISPDFASDSSVYDMAGILAFLFFVFVYYKTSVMFKKYSILISPILASLGFFFVAVILQFLKFTIYYSLLLSILSILLFIYLFKDIEDVRVNKVISLDYKILFSRAIFATIVIIVITEIANSVGSTWSGLLSAFPKTVFPILLIMHFSYGIKPTNSIIKNLPRGLGSLVVYDLSVFVLYPTYGIYIGTIISLILAIIYSSFAHIASRRQQSLKNPQMVKPYERLYIL